MEAFSNTSGPDGLELSEPSISANLTDAVAMASLYWLCATERRLSDAGVGVPYIAFDAVSTKSEYRA